VRRIFAWLFTLALTAGGVLLAHEAAYRLSGTRTGSVHAYLSHAPQLVVVLATLTLGALAFTSRAPRLAAWPFPAIALAGFFAQEHVEQLLHSGQVPWLLTQPVFAIGLALQMPVALAAWLLARRLLRAVTEARPRRTPKGMPRYPLAPFARPGAVPAGRPLAAVAARGPPPAPLPG
jgi:hypothetical protein